MPRPVDSFVPSPAFFEALESRRHLSAVLNDGVLTITGSENPDELDVFVPKSVQNKIYVVTALSNINRFFIRDVHQIDINAGAGNDIVAVFGEFLPASIRVNIDGGDGNDRISTSHTRDSILGGAGNDTISSSSGNDTVFGGDGDDRINGASGRDSIDGEGGNDTILGGDGADTLTGSDGDDSLSGQGGRDSIFGDAGSDTIIGGSNVDVIFGGDDADHFTFIDNRSELKDFDDTVDIITVTA